MKSAGWVLGIVAMMVSFRGPSDALAPRTESRETAGGLVTLYSDDPLTHDFSFARGEHGGTFQEHVRVNTGADIDYGEVTAKTKAGTVGVKCWIFKGEILPQRRRGLAPSAPSRK